MKILIVSFHFPPYAPPAASRMGKLAKFLLENGHDVRVLCARTDGNSGIHNLEVPEERIIATEWFDVATLPDRFLERFKSLVAPKPDEPKALKSPQRSNSKKPRKTRRQALRRLYNALVCWPDNRGGWIRPAVEAGGQLLDEWQADLIYASGPPPSTFVVARKLSVRSGIPWVAELRDLWIDNPYEDRPGWRKMLERPYERRTLSSAKAFVTVSPLWKDQLNKRFGKETLLVLNGFDEKEYPASLAHERDPDQPLTLFYAGSLYQDRREPNALFEAIKLLGPDAQRVKFRLAGPWMKHLNDLAQEMGIGSSIEVLGTLPHEEIIRLQYESDILVLLQWNNAQDAGTIPGKLFEYIAVGRPILATGYEKGVVAEIVSEHHLGATLNDPQELMTFLKEQIGIGRPDQCAPESLKGAARETYTRQSQFTILNEWLPSLKAPEG